MVFCDGWWAQVFRTRPDESPSLNIEIDEHLPFHSTVAAFAASRRNGRRWVGAFSAAVLLEAGF